MNPSLPITLISGYLGSGKTTLINQLLSMDDSPKIGLLVNDFGTLNIDQSLIESDDAVVGLANGCVCCAINDDLGTAIDTIQRTPNLECLVMEASGVAATSRLTDTLLSWPGLQLQQVVYVVDCDRIERLSSDKFVGRHIQNELRWADTLWLTKQDLVSADGISSLMDWLGCKTTAHPTHLRSILTALTGVSSYAIKAGVPDKHPNFTTKSFIADKVIEREQLLDWLAELPVETRRVKGLIKLEGKQHLLQVVDRHIQLSQLPTQANHTIQLVAICQEGFQIPDLPI